ncbi:MAG: hypothetical protein ACU0BP_00905, partial [Sulfitobacter sp.]
MKDYFHSRCNENFGGPVANLNQSSADFVEKHRVAGAESGAPNWVQALFLSGFAQLLRCRKDLSQFPEVLGG